METVHKTIDILESFLKEPGEIGIAELSEKCGINITTAHRIAADLVKRGYLRQKQKRGKYSVGIKLLEYCGVIQSNLKIGEIAFPYLQKISQSIGEYSEIAVLDDYTSMTIAQVEITHNLKIANTVGERLPLHATALGKIFLSYMTKAELDSYFGSHALFPFTAKTIVAIDRLEQELQKIKRLGYTIDNEEYDIGVWAIAAPVFDCNQDLIAGLSIAAPSVRIDEGKQKEYQEIIKSNALAISREIGYPAG